MVFEKIIFQSMYVELETPPPLHGKIHLKFPILLFEDIPNGLFARKKKKFLKGCNPRVWRALMVIEIGDLLGIQHVVDGDQN